MVLLSDLISDGAGFEQRILLHRSRFLVLQLYSTNSTMNWIKYNVDRSVVLITGKNKRWISLILLRGCVCVCGAWNSRRSSTQGDDEISVPSAGASEMQDTSVAVQLLCAS